MRIISCQAHHFDKCLILQPYKLNSTYTNVRSGTVLGLKINGEKP